MPSLKGTEASLSCAQCFLYLVSSTINVSIFHITWLDTLWTDFMSACVCVHGSLKFHKTPAEKLCRVLPKNVLSAHSLNS